MIAAQNVWALVLAGGEGKRLHALTAQPGGAPVPKQFCSLRGERSLIEEAIDRGAGLVDTERICAIVGAAHRPWWSQSAALQRLPSDNLIVQPCGRGTAVGILYAVLHIARKDPGAMIVLLPSDHHVTDEGTLRESLVAALQRIRKDANGLVLLGLEPDRPDSELGYILPGARDPFGGYRVRRFVEKPNVSAARSLVEEGGLWNMFIVIARARRLIDLLQSRLGELVSQMQAVIARAPTAGSTDWQDLEQLYERMPETDFSRDVLEGQEASLCVMRVRPCGWSDLGTPRRVGETLRRLPAQDYVAAVSRRSAFVNLAARHDRLQRQA